MNGRSDQGSLERAVLERLWDRGDATVRELTADFPTHAYTTIQTICLRLESKGHLTKTRDGRAWRFAPRASREQYIAALLHDVLDQSSHRDSALLHFVDSASDHDLDLLKKALKKRTR